MTLSVQVPQASPSIMVPSVNRVRPLRLIPRSLANEHENTLFDSIEQCRDSFLFVSRLLSRGMSLRKIGQDYSCHVGRYSEEYVRMNIERELQLYVDRSTQIIHVKRNTYFDHEKVDLLLNTGYGEYLIPIQVKSSRKAKNGFDRKKIPFIACLYPGQESLVKPYIKIIKCHLELSGSNRVRSLFGKAWKYV